MVERELIVGNGIILRKYFLDVSQDEQRRRFEAGSATRSSTGS
jgi:polyphosphate kinase